MASTKDGPGFWWSLLEFMGMTWPGRPEAQGDGPRPVCSACHNPAQRVDGAWRCPVHPQAQVELPAEDE